MFDGVRYRFASAENMNRFQGRSRRLRSGALAHRLLARLPGHPREPHPRTAAVELAQARADQRRRIADHANAGRPTRLNRGPRQMRTMIIYLSGL